MTKRVCNTHEMCFVRAMMQHPIPNCTFNYADSYFILAPSLLSTLFAVLFSSTSLRPLFLLRHFVIEDYLAMELLFSCSIHVHGCPCPSMDNWMNCLHKTHFRPLLHVHEASKASDWKQGFFFPYSEECMVGRKKRWKRVWCTWS